MCRLQDLAIYIVAEFTDSLQHRLLRKSRCGSFLPLRSDVYDGVTVSAQSVISIITRAGTPSMAGMEVLDVLMHLRAKGKAVVRVGSTPTMAHAECQSAKSSNSPPFFCIRPKFLP